MKSPPTPAGEPAIVMEDATIGALRDQSISVVEQVNWTVAPGEYWVVGGLQGSGKSDFLMFAGGLMPALAGNYRLFGEPMPIFEESRMEQRLRLGLVFEGGQMLSHLTVWENIALPLRYHRNLAKAEAVTQVQPWLRALELEPWADTTPGALGRNWQRRVGLARALILRPEILLIDGPLSGLDLRHALWWLGFLRQLSKGHPLLEHRPLTLVVTTADLRPWRNESCRFAILRDRRFVALGGWTDLENAGTELVHELFPTETNSP